MTFLRSWLLSVTACAVLISIAQQLANDGAMKKIVRFVGGMVLMLAMLRPLLSLSFDLPALDGESYREAVEALKETLSAEQEDADPILMAFAAEAAKGDPASPEARELVLRWQAHLVKFSRSCDEEKLRRLADLYSWDNRFAEVLDSYGPGTAHFMGEAIEAYLETL